MFDFFDKKTKKTIMYTIVITLIFEFLAIFISYSSLQIKEYFVRAENTSKQNSKYIDLCMNHYENSISLLIESHSDKFKNANQIELFNLFKEFMTSNTNISNIFFYNDKLTASYDTLSTQLNDYISCCKQDKNVVLAPRWDIFDNNLLYTSPILADNNLCGHLVIYISDNALISYSKNTNYKENGDIVTVLRSQTEFKPLIGLTDSFDYNFDNLPDFSTMEYSKTNLLTHTTNTPLNEKGISVMNIIFFSQAYKRIIILGIVIGVILILSILLAYYLITSYNKSLVKRLKQLSSDIAVIPHNLSKEEIVHENFEQH